MPTGSGRRRGIRRSPRSLSESEIVGHVWLNTDVTDATGYSGKPIAVLVAADTDGVIRGIKLMEHHEPIVLIGIPQQRIVGALNHLVGAAMGPVARGEQRPPQSDIVSGATVTVLVIADSVVRSTVKLLRAGRLGAARGARRRGAAAGTGGADACTRARRGARLGQPARRRLDPAVAPVHRRGERGLRPQRQPGRRGQSRSPATRTIPSSTSMPRSVSVPTIGRSLLGDAGYERLAARLRPGQQAILVAGEGVYSFKGSGYVRGGIFDRVQLLQDGRTLRFRDRDHTRLGDIAAAGRRACPRSGSSSSRRNSTSTRRALAAPAAGAAGDRCARQGVPDLRIGLPPARAVPRPPPPPAPRRRRPPRRRPAAAPRRAGAGRRDRSGSASGGPRSWTSASPPSR